MQTILIPTDFSQSTFNCVAPLCEQFKGESINLIFIHFFKLSDSINELLLLSRRQREYEQVSDQFYEGCNQSKLLNPQIRATKIDFFYGSTVAMFRNYLEANNIDYIAHFPDCVIKKLNPATLDPSVLISRSGLPVVELSSKRAEALANRPVKEEKVTALEL